MARTQKNKATMGHLGLLKAKLAKLKRELITPKGGGATAGEGFDVAKTGDARIGFVGELLPCMCVCMLFDLFISTSLQIWDFQIRFIVSIVMRYVVWNIEKYE